MIASMKKITLLCMERDKNVTLQELQDLGVIHLQPVSAPEGSDVEAAKERLGEAKRALEFLKNSHENSEVQVNESNHDAELAVTRTTDLSIKRQHYEDERIELEAEIRKLQPYGDFEPELVKQLATRNIAVRLFHETDKKPVSIPEGADRVILSENGPDRFIAVIGQQLDACTGEALPLPTQSISSLTKRLELVKGRLTDIGTEMTSSLAPQSGAITKHIERLTDESQFANARAGMGNATGISYLQGYCAADLANQLETAAGQHGWGIVIGDPAADDNVPSLVRHPAWVKPIKAVLDIIKITPGYREQDISVVFLIFFSIFFAMLIGDAGYGLIFLAMTAFARFKMKKAPAYPFSMLALLSVCTVIWGTVTGNYFGVTAENAPLSGFQFAWLQDSNNVMALCFTIGAVHMTIAHVWRFILLAPNRKCLEQVGWIAVLWSMFFHARNLVAQVPAPGYTNILLGVGVLLVALFMCTTKEELKRDGINLAMLPLSIVSALVDVISYIRLFAVGMASLSVAESFNSMAAGIGMSNVLTMFGSAMILLLGHALNIVLCGLAVLVHGVRLNTLEFSMHMGMEWSGSPFTPFKKIANTET
jgi:V/A-type H+-transporting ATPase subunit I